MSTRLRHRLTLPAALSAAAVLLAFAPPGRPAPVPESAPGGVVVLDNCDPVWQGKKDYEDNLSFLDGAAKLLGRASGLNLCEEIGSPHRVAVDPARKCVWVAESVGRRLLQYDLQGKLLSARPDVTCSALAVDPETGDVWVTGSGRVGEGATTVFDKGGNLRVGYSFTGYDIAYDKKGKAFWLAGPQLLKVSPDGKVLRNDVIADWTAVSLAVHPETGAVWVVTRAANIRTGLNLLLGFDNAGKLLHTVPLDERVPFRVAVNARDGSVWVTIFGKSVAHYSATGELLAEHKLAALAADVDPSGGNVWVVTPDAVVKLDPGGKELARSRLKAKTSQAWLAAY
jgi:DNA-binding beta-propeller fold protein YncE